ncbi:hypothetical protein PCE1_002571 [Barthelona sp. PCE]
MRKTVGRRSSRTHTLLKPKQMNNYGSSNFSNDDETMVDKKFAQTSVAIGKVKSELYEVIVEFSDENALDILNLSKEKEDLKKEFENEKIEHQVYKSQTDLKISKMNNKISKLNNKIQIILDTLSKIVPDTGNAEFVALTERIDECATSIKQLNVPQKSFFKWLSSNPKVETMEEHLDDLDMTFEFVNGIDIIIKDYDLRNTLSTTYANYFADIIKEFPIAEELNEDLYVAKLEELEELDAYFIVFNNCIDIELNRIHNSITLLMDKNASLIKSSKHVVEISEQIFEFREALGKDEEPAPFDFDLLYSLRDQIERHRVDIVACETVHFERAKQDLLSTSENNLKLIDDLICEFSLAVDLTATLEELHLSSIRFPTLPKIISFNSYLNGDLEDFGLNNGIKRKNDRFIKCICVSKRLSEESLNFNLKALRRELRVLTKLHPFAVALKNVVFVPEVKRGSVKLKFVCIELEHAQYDLEQYLRSFPDLHLSIRNTLAHQLVMAVFMMHATGIILRDLKPQNVLVFCNEDGSNPKLKMCDFGVSISNNHTMGGTMVGTIGYMAREVTEGQPHTFLSDIFSLGKTVGYIFAKDRSDISNLILHNDCAHSEIIQRCQAHDARLRPSIYELSCHEWRTNTITHDRLSLINLQINQFVVAKHALLRDNERDGNIMKFVQTGVTFDDFFLRVFGDVDLFMNSAEYFGATIKLHGMEQLSLAHFVDHVFEYRSLPQIKISSSDDLIDAICGFLYCCFVFQIPVDDVQVGQFVLNAISGDFDKLSDATVFDRVFPTESAYILNMLKHDDLNFNCFGGEERPVTADNIEEFMQLARDMVSCPWVDLSNKINATFNSHELTSQLGVTLTFVEIKSIMCGPPRFTAEQVLSTLDYNDEVPNDIRDVISKLMQGFNSLDLLQFVYWLNSSSELNPFTVILQPADNMLPSVSLCDHTLRLPNSVMRVREGLPLAIRGILPNEFKLLITQSLSQWNKDDIDELNNRLQNAPLITIEFNQIENVPSVRICPNCLTPIEHGGACKSMKCSTCARDFCFACLSPACGHHGYCNVAQIQQVTLDQVQERMKQFQ